MPRAVHNLRWSAELAGEKSHCCYCLFLIAMLPRWSCSVSCLLLHSGLLVLTDCCFLALPLSFWCAGEPGWTQKLSPEQAVKREMCLLLFAGPGLHGCWRDAAAPLWVQPMARSERSCCTAAVSLLHGYLGGKGGCHQKSGYWHWSPQPRAARSHSGWVHSSGRWAVTRTEQGGDIGLCSPGSHVARGGFL